MSTLIDINKLGEEIKIDILRTEIAILVATVTIGFVLGFIVGQLF